MNNQTPFSFASTAALGFGLFGGLRLRALCFREPVSRRFQVFLASSPYSICASGSLFRSVRLLQTRPFLTTWSNPAVKLTRQRRAAYFVR